MWKKIYFGNWSPNPQNQSWEHISPHGYAPKSAFRAADVHAIIQSGNVFIKQPMEVIHNGSVAVITTHAATVAGSNPPTVSYTAEISSGDVILKISGVGQNTTITCVVRYTLI